ncbi:hypothetical protein THASP1DRAFT_29682 [Thamnocephalis sphaerospora]|uniref:HemN C-terminal domain-containing protein n=1 Tax=Thamnocephalis sphaerospora TaxID=78915 RepID=A0A4P9XR29_9FUNG|nr:hypothetical protein THASP1DRAFT_29682 [Thamnocephalis sphaerospora]|eukprot:RKP08527.1 hypothetical protein THASP1DRAFT_29682 [Thamnocephalis sphaerospora]
MRKAVPLLSSEYAQELIVLGMRMKDGIESRQFLKHTGAHLREHLNMEEVERLSDAGYLLWQQEIPSAHAVIPEHSTLALQPTEKGLAVIDSVLDHILA